MRVKYIILAKLLFIVSTTTLVSGGVVKVRKCPTEFPQGDAYLNLEMLRVQDCEAQPCVFEKGKTYTVEGRGVFNYTTTMIKVIIIMHVQPLPPINVFKFDTCEYFPKGTCVGIKPGFVVATKQIWNTESSYPSGQGILRVVLLSDLDEPIWCGEVTMIIKGASAVENVPGVNFLHVMPAKP